MNIEKLLISIGLTIIILISFISYFEHRGEKNILLQLEKNNIKMQEENNKRYLKLEKEIINKQFIIKNNNKIIREEIIKYESNSHANDILDADWVWNYNNSTMYQTENSSGTINKTETITKAEALSIITNNNQDCIYDKIRLEQLQSILK